jgi:hypothetical protein
MEYLIILKTLILKNLSPTKLTTIKNKSPSVIYRVILEKTYDWINVIDNSVLLKQ